MTARQSTLILVTEGVAQQTRKQGKHFTLGSVYTLANKGRAYWMPREDWPIESRPVPKRLPSHMIPLHLPMKESSPPHRVIMAGFTRGKGFRTA
jgi:hypothetical protein